MCAYLAGALLVALFGNALVGAWYLGSVVGLLIAAVALKKGADSWKGMGCCVGPPLDGFGFADAPATTGIAQARPQRAAPPARVMGGCSWS